MEWRTVHDAGEDEKMLVDETLFLISIRTCGEKSINEDETEYRASGWRMLRETGSCMDLAAD